MKRTPRSSSRLVNLEPSSWSRARLRDILDEIAGQRILVIGDVGVDRYTMGSVERISPEAPVPIVFVEEEKHKLGLAANVADNVRALGAEALLVGIVGKDRVAGDFRALLKSEGISDSHLLVDASRRTVLKERIVSDRQQLLRVDYESIEPVSAPVRARLVSQVSRLARRASAVILEDYA